MFIKKRVKWGSATGTTGETIAWPSTEQTAYFNSEVLMDVAINFKSIGGTGTPSITFSVQEEFGDGLFWETGNSGAKTTAAKFLISHDIDQSSKGWPSLGRGYNKQIVTTMGGTVTAVSADIYAVLYTAE